MYDPETTIYHSRMPLMVGVSLRKVRTERASHRPH